MSKRIPVLQGFEARSVKLMAAWSLVLIAGAAYPDGVIQPPDDHGPNPLASVFLDADANKDGQLSRQEAQAFPILANHFDEMDQDGDQQLSQTEVIEGLRG
ncbi:hypothetical protein [Hydrogenophaga sp. 5NK40-0174]|uniref:hypothetical protein n=1 Tax=Hydrogenophaga sp. 5NK40-0174 TaxID=3127649 RepID=UPI0031048897